MGEQVVTRIVHREIVVGDGALKPKVEKPLTEEEKHSGDCAIILIGE